MCSFSGIQKFFGIFYCARIRNSECFEFGRSPIARITFHEYHSLPSGPFAHLLYL